MIDAWPQGVPESLWKHFQPLSVPAVPMMGVRPANGFLMAAVVGAIFLLFFARDRFVNQSGAAEQADYKVLTELKVRDLGGHTALRRAYLVYAFVLLLIYIAMTFFGNLLVGSLRGGPDGRPLFDGPMGRRAAGGQPKSAAKCGLRNRPSGSISRRTASNRAAWG